MKRHSIQWVVIKSFLISFKETFFTYNKIESSLSEISLRNIPDMLPSYIAKNIISLRLIVNDILGNGGSGHEDSNMSCFNVYITFKQISNLI